MRNGGLLSTFYSLPRGTDRREQPLDPTALNSFENIFVPGLTIVLSYVYIPITSSHPRARSRALKCGDDRGGAGGDAPVQASGLVRRHPAGWGGGRWARYAARAPAAQAAWSRRASRASPGAFGAAPYRGTDRQVLLGPASGG